MRNAYWMMLCGCLAAAQALACSRSPEFRPLGTTKDLMAGTVTPSSQEIFNAALWVDEPQPKPDEEWLKVQHSALTLAESGNLLLIGDRAKDHGDWPKMSHAMMDAAVVAQKAAAAKDLKALVAAGDHLYETCTACHKKYYPQGEQ